MINWLIRIGSNSYEKYLGSLLTNENYIQEEIKFAPKTENSCYYSVQTHLASLLLAKNLKIKIYMPVVPYDCKIFH